jgi:lipopolysaccharide assembly protein A
VKGQWTLILSFLFALIVATFAVINGEAVPVDFLFLKKSIPLILVILGSVFMGGFIVGSVGLYRIYKLQKEIKMLRSQVVDDVTESATDNVSELELNETTEQVDSPENGSEKLEESNKQ